MHIVQQYSIQCKIYQKIFINHKKQNFLKMKLTNCIFQTIYVSRKLIFEAYIIFNAQSTFALFFKFRKVTN
jgi:hypothetical protein